jgi:hypothetical protein
VYSASKLDPDGIDADHPANLDDAALGAVAREALLASRFIGPEHPDRDRVDAFLKKLSDKELLDRFKAPAGVKTHGALYSGVGKVSLTLKDGIISLRPMKYEGRGGFTTRRVEPTELPEAGSDVQVSLLLMVAAIVRML